MSTISEEMTKQKEQCTLKIQPSEMVIVPNSISSPEFVTTNQICSIPYDLEKKLKEAWANYEVLVKGDENGTIDMVSMKQVKENISNAETEINLIKQSCQPQYTANSGNSGSKPQEVPSQAPSTPNQNAPGQSGVAPGQTIKPGEECTVPVELTQEFEGLWKGYNEALANNDTTKAEEMKTVISTIEQKISSTKGQCVKTIVSDNVGTRDVAGYYKQKVTEVMAPGMDTDSQITQLKILRNEIDNMIMELLNKKNKLNASDVSGVVDEIKMKHNSIQAGNSTISTTTATISTQINNQNIEVQPSETGVTMTDGTTVVSIPELSIRANKISIADQVIQVAPSAVMVRAKMQNQKQLNMSVENGTPIYNIKGDENRNFLWVVPVTMEKQVKIDATNGNVLSEEKPWWSGLTSESQ